MAERKVKQIIYHGDKSKKNYPKEGNNSKALSISINSITGIKEGVIERIGVQNYSNKEGKIYLKTIADLEEYGGERLIRPFEIYEFTLKSFTVVKDFYFDLNFINSINNSNHDYLIIDIIYKI